MKTKRLSERYLCDLVASFGKRERKNDTFYESARDALSYRRALLKVRRYFEPRALEGSMSGSLALQQLNIIDRALGAKR